VAPNVATNNAQAQRADPGSIFNFYKAMLKLRNTRPSIARGSYEHSFAQGLVVGWQRATEAERTLVLINYGKEEAPTDVPGLVPRTRLLPLWPRTARAVSASGDGTARLLAPAQSVQVYRVLK
jgi:glycosidase